MMDKKQLKFDVFGQRVLVEATSGGWIAFYLGNDGKRRRADFSIPDHLEEGEVAQFLDDLFHESATAQRPAVRIL